MRSRSQGFGANRFVSTRKICIVSHTSKLEGAGRSLLETVMALTKAGFDVVVVLPRGGALVEALKVQGTQYCLWPVYWWLGRLGEPVHVRVLRYCALLFCIASLPLLATLFRKQRLNVIYSNTIASPAGLVLARLLRVPHVSHIREFVEEDHGLMYLFGKARSLSALAERSEVILANSRAVSNHFAPLVGGVAPVVVYQAVQVPAERPSSNALQRSGPPVCLLLGRLDPGKGQELAIEAFAMLAESGLEALLRIVGPGKSTYRDHLQQMVRARGLVGTVEILEPTSDPVSEYQMCDVLIMVSRMEAFGRVTVEAMKYGKPVVGAASGGTIELIEAGKTGWLFESGSPSALAHVLREALRDRDKLVAMGKAAHAWALQAFNEERYSRELVAALLPALDSESDRTHQA